MNKHRVIGVDLSKKSTGISIVDVDNLDLKIVDNFSIQPKKPDSFNKLYFYAKDMLCERLGQVFKTQECKFSVAFEFVVYSDYTSELQFYLTQELLRLCYIHNIDAIGYSPHFLKKFVKLFVDDGKKYSSHLQKLEIREIYERYVYPMNKGVLPESKLILDDDSMDALFLGILGGILQGSISNVKINPEQMTTQGILNHEFDNFLLINSNYYREIYLDEVRDFEFNNFRFNLVGKEFKEALEVLEEERDGIQKEYANFNKLLAEGNTAESWKSLGLVLKKTNDSLKKCNKFMPILKESLEKRGIKIDSPEDILKAKNKKIPKMIVIPKQTKLI